MEETSGVISFDIQTPLNSTTIKRHIKNAKSLGLREALDEPKTLNIVATGPSAKAVHGTLTGDTLALNGALAFYPDPTFYACCDPQAMVADFLRNPPEDCIFYVASKCHPRVFKALKDRDIRLWHISDYVPGGVSCAVSITLTAMNLFAQLGYRRFNVYGWDACFAGDGSHHANVQEAPPQNRITLSVGDHTFATTTTWAAEAQDATAQLALLDYMGIEVNIHGDSMIKAVYQEIRKAA